MRYLPDVIREMLHFIPEEEDGLRTDLERCLEKERYTSPELANWANPAAYLWRHLHGREGVEWVEKVLIVWRDDDKPADLYD